MDGVRKILIIKIVTPLSTVKIIDSPNYTYFFHNCALKTTNNLEEFQQKLLRQQ